jgi:hypothetical protein
LGIAAGFVVALSTLSPTADLIKVERRISKEPAYRTKRPGYCLLVFGPRADKKVWLVLDGDALYVDRNANGDLTEADERLTPSAFGQIPGLTDPDQKRRTFVAGKLFEVPGKSRHTLTLNDERHWGKTTRVAEVMIGGKHDQYATLEFAAKPSDAPVAWFDGPLTLCRYDNDVLARGDKPTTLSFAVCTRGRGATTFVAYAGLIPDNALPEAHVEFPGKGHGSPPVKVKLRFDHRC